jgi:DNA-directed RNA polymerase subunit L
MSNACCVKLYLEDHTIGTVYEYLGNLVRMSLLKQKEVTYSGYRQIHPL